MLSQVELATTANCFSQITNIWRAYHDCPVPARLRVISRYSLCPYDRFLSFFPPAGRILDVGCGDGLLFLLLSQRESQPRAYLGVDPAKSKIDVANRARIKHAEFRYGEVSTLATETFDCVSVVDVLYLMEKDHWGDFLSQCVRVLKGNGLLIVKEVVGRPRWKYWISYMEEILAIKVVGMTKGDVPHFEPIEVYRGSIDAAGAQVFRVERIDAWRPHAHVVFLARKS